jgi:hypothetical protein
MTFDNCWYYQNTTCDAMIANGCQTNQQLQRGIIIGSNGFYGIPIAILFYRLYTYKQAWEQSHCLFVFACFMVLTNSSMYHACDDTTQHIWCNQYCITPNLDQLENGDFLSSGFAAIVSSVIDWTYSKNLFYNTYMQTIPYVYIFVTNYMFQESMDVFTYFVAGVFLGTCILRICLQDLLLQTYSKILALAAIGFLCLAYLLEYTTLLNLPLTVAHSLWHICTALALCTVPYLFCDHNRAIKVMKTGGANYTLLVKTKKVVRR